MTDAGRFARAERVFLEACRRPPAERADFIRAHCGDDAELASDVLALVQEDGRDARFLESPAIDSALLAQPYDAMRRDLDAPLPAAIGSYRVLRLLGAGGMGTVYEAEQQHPRRRVALKVIAAGLATAERARRFQREAELLGRLTHPGIARILEAGTFRSAAGELPFLAMDLIDGIPITAYVERHAVAIDGRLALIGEIAAAVQHAHDRGVLHRDLKPSNVLVDAGGRPHILDFGVALPLEEAGRTGTLRTLAGQLVGTLPYMSPEQATGPAAELDGRSDVYSLGVLAWRLLAGRLPFDLRELPVHEAVRRVLEQEPPPLATVVPGIDPDVAVIVHTAMEKNRDRRYSSARALKEDIERQRASLPILARPPEALYQLRQFRRRHRALLTGVAAMLVPLALLAAYALREAREARAAQHRAEENLARAETARRDTDDIVEFMIELFGERLSVRSQSPRWVKESKERVAGLVGDYMNEHPVSFAYMTEVFGAMHDRDGRRAEAIATYGDAVLRYSKAIGPAHPWTLRARRNLAVARWRAGELDEAAAALAAIVEDAEQVLGPDHAFTVHAVAVHGTVLTEMGLLAAADNRLQTARERHLRAGSSERLTTEILRTLARLRRLQGRHDEARALADQVIESADWVPFR